MRKGKLSVGVILMIVSFFVGNWNGDNPAVADPETPAVVDTDDTKPTTLAVVNDRLTRIESQVVSLTARKVCECRDSSDDDGQGETNDDFTQDESATEPEAFTMQADCSSGQCSQAATQSRGLFGRSRGRLLNWRPFRR